MRRNGRTHDRTRVKFFFLVYCLGVYNFNFRLKSFRYDEEEIERKVAKFRKQLMEKNEKEEEKLESAFNENGRLV